MADEPLQTIGGIYIDPETGKAISTHSMLKTFRRCPKQAEYKYIRRLKPRVLGRPLRAGTWMHRLEEVYYKDLKEGGDGSVWKDEHAKLSRKFNELFDEEKDEIGDLPRDCERMFKSYLWHYKADTWKVLEIEFVLECEFPNGTVFRCKIDLLIEDQFGLWIVDHKWHKTLPNLKYRILDSQSADYIWCALKNRIPVQGHIWNYGRSKPPTIPALLKDGTRLSRAAIDTDYPTMITAIRKYGLDPTPYMPTLRYLNSLRYQPGEAQLSPFFLRSVLEKDRAMLRRVAQEAYHTSKRMHEYPFDQFEAVERNVDRSCTFMCSYSDICAAELWGANSRPMVKAGFTVGDPMDYYYDQDRDIEEKGER